MERKGQAAMEFLMTYGWAILVAIIAIGVLAYYGVFNPGRFISESVIVNEPFNAKGVVITGGASGTANIQLELYNGAGEAVTIDSIAITKCRDPGVAPSEFAYASGETKITTVTCTASALTAGDSFKGDITVTYHTASSLLAKIATGSVLVKSDKFNLFLSFLFYFLILFYYFIK